METAFTQYEPSRDDVESEVPASESLRLQERHNLRYDPEPTVRGVGATGIQLANSTKEMSMDTVQQQPETADNEAFVARANGLVYSQDQEVYASYVSQARSIVLRCMAGDESAYDTLSPTFGPLLQVRVASYEGVVSADEIDGMISTVCIDLKRQVEGE